MKETGDIDSVWSWFNEIYEVIWKDDLDYINCESEEKEKELKNVEMENQVG
jgi:hypothetical protein